MLCECENKEAKLLTLLALPGMHIVGIQRLSGSTCGAADAEGGSFRANGLPTYSVSFVRVPPQMLSPGGPQRHNRAPLPRLLSLFPCWSTLLVLSCLGLLAVATAAAAAEAPRPISPSSCSDPDKSLKATVVLPMDGLPPNPSVYRRLGPRKHCPLTSAVSTFTTG